MNLISLFIIAVGLSMDAFAVAICKGLCMKKAALKASVVVGLYFGLFQAGMPLIGYFIGSQFADSIKMFDHWIAFILLLLIGGKMIKESFSPSEDYCEINGAEFTPSKMLPLALATSIDALAVGVSFAFLEVRIVPAVIFIGVITFGLSFVGIIIGNVFGVKYKAKAELAGGVILILMGTKILIEHLFFA